MIKILGIPSIDKNNDFLKASLDYNKFISEQIKKKKRLIKHVKKSKK